DLSFFGFIPNRIFGVMTNEVLLAVPLFVFMGVMLERSKVADDLLNTMGGLFGTMRGGLGISVCIVGALLAASTGIVGATVVTMGLLSLPTMLRWGYDPKLAAGTICASGTLGQIIPPSIVLVVLGDQISNAYQDAQRQLGNWAPDPVSVGDLFAGALIPGLMLVGMYISWQLIMAAIRPESAPAVSDVTALEKISLSKTISALVVPIILIIAVLGSILAGIATPTEAAAVGAMGATLLGGLRLAPGKKGSIMLIGGLALVGVLILSGTFDLRLGRDAITNSEQLGIYVAAAGSVLVGLGILDALRRIKSDGTLNEV
ncbi:MAG: TRAP transporter large permease, partial [Alphaproteobacteria bacterium]